jgi:gliding motility-associated-like protein
VILPQTSNNGILGMWNPAMLSTTNPGINTYSFTPDPGQCASPTSLNVTVNPTLTPTFASIPALCQNVTAPSLPTTSTNSISGSWSPASINTSTLGTSTYTFTPTAGLCAEPATLDVVINTAPNPSFSSNLTQGCAPLNVQIAITNPSGNATYSWTINGVASGNGSSISPTLTSETCYDISVQANENGCIGNTTLNDLICVQEIPSVSFTASPNQITNNNQTVSFSNIGANSLDYSWQFGDGQSSSEYSPTHAYSNANEGMNVTLTATSSFGCVGTATVFIPFKEEGDFYVPNSFTPDEDEFNQNWLPIFTQGFDPFNFNVFIFDRWGEIVWENHDYQRGWDGTYGEKGGKAPDGVYIWRIEYKPVENDKKIVVMGHLTLMR